MYGAKWSTINHPMIMSRLKYERVVPSTRAVSTREVIELSSPKYIVAPYLFTAHSCIRSPPDAPSLRASSLPPASPPVFDYPRSRLRSYTPGVGSYPRMHCEYRYRDLETDRTSRLSGKYGFHRECTFFRFLVSNFEPPLARLSRDYGGGI